MGALRAGGEVPVTSMAQPAPRAATDRYIERHLLDGTISPTSLAATHGVSIRTVNRIFNATGQTVGELIRIRRLARAREDLTDSDRSVSSIAHRWDFADSSHFSLGVKARYGTWPCEYRLTARSMIGAHVHRPVAAIHGPSPAVRETVVTAARS